jgi:UDP-glucose 4-epimerase
MMTLEDAVNLVLYAFENGQPGQIFVQKSPAATIKTLVAALKDLLKIQEHPINIIGTRHGEKLYETLLSREEMAAAQDLAGYYRILPDSRDLNYAKFVEEGQARLTQSCHGEDYNSHNTKRLDVAEMKNLLLKLDFIQSLVRGESAVAED